jgi:anhydro-N-acetylmuramic acid kinase
MSKVLRAIGLMSGTSLDGIDVALIETDGRGEVVRGPAATYAYTANFKVQLRQCLLEARHLANRTARPGMLAGVEQELTQRHAEALARFLSTHGLQGAGIDVIGFHGQTVLHRPDQRLTVQIGDGQLLAKLTGIDVVYDLRSADCVAGGQGAPLVPVYHRALVDRLPQRPIAVVNIGGVSNVTYIGRTGDLVAFDTGPGNAMIDDWMCRHTTQSFDEHGSFAATGTPSELHVAEYQKHSHFAAVPPKSLDRNAFPLELITDLSPKDGAATLTAFTAASIARAREHFPEEPALWIVCGGGRKNRTLMGMLAARVENAVVPAEAVGLDGDSLEAEAWAYLAVRALEKLPITFPGTTGVPQAMTGGVLAKAR